MSNCSAKIGVKPEIRTKLAQTGHRNKERASVGEKEQHESPAETLSFITCRHCTVEFRKTDLPPGGKCPVCGRALKVDAS